MSKVKVTKFADSVKAHDGQHTHWFETTEGKRHTCKEETVAKLWEVWMEQEGAKRENTPEDRIFVFKEPIEL